MSSLLIILSILIVVIGIFGCLIPGLPGSPLFLVALLIARFCAEAPITNTELIVYTIFVVLTFVADFFVPLLTTKVFGGSKAGMWGSILGLIMGFFIPIPTYGLGIVIWPFIGAVLGEKLIANKTNKEAFKSGFGNFVGFVLTTLFKLVIAVWALYKLVISFPSFSEFFNNDFFKGFVESFNLIKL